MQARERPVSPLSRMGNDVALAHGWSLCRPRQEPAGDGDPLGPSCVTGDGADEPLPAAPASVAQESQCQALPQGARHAPRLISTWCPQVTPVLASSLSSPLLRKSICGNGSEDAELPHPASAGTPSTVQPPERGALGGLCFGEGPGELAFPRRARARTPFLTSCPTGER